MVEHIKLVNKKSKQRTSCGEGGIRTRGALLELTHFPGVRLRPLGHLSFTRFLGCPLHRELQNIAQFT